MPFTFSHPAIILPLKKVSRHWFSINGLVIGSMAPDIAYFFQMDGNADIGHSLVGIFLFDLPISFLVGLLYHQWVRNILIDYLPTPLDKHFTLLKDFNFVEYLRKKWLIFVFSAFIGSLSHLFWDGLAEKNGLIDRLSPGLLKKTVSLAGITVTWDVFIEHTGSVVGLLVVIAALLTPKTYFSEQPNPVRGRSKLYYWMGIVLMALVVTALKIELANTSFTIGSTIVILISAFSFSLLFVSAILTIVGFNYMGIKR